MRISVTSTLLLGSSFTAVVSAGTRFSDRVYERYARPEKFSAAQPKPRSLEERSDSYRFMTNATKRKSLNCVADD